MGGCGRADGVARWTCVEWVSSALQLFGEHGPWVIVGGAIATTAWLSAFMRALMTNRLHLTAQCEARYAVLNERLAEKDRLYLERDAWHERRYDRLERVTMTNTDTAVRTVTVAEQAVEKVAQLVTKTTDGKPG
jgi:hypothetical protein